MSEEDADKMKLSQKMKKKAEFWQQAKHAKAVLQPTLPIIEKIFDS